MTVTLLFLGVLMAIVAGWLVRQSINVRPWVAQSTVGNASGGTYASWTRARVGLAVFLAVATSVFALTISAYSMRMHAGTDWQALPEPLLLWVNSAILLCASVAMQAAWRAARRGQARALALGLSLGGAGAIAFIAGQWLVWRQLNAAGYYMAANPANAFFFLLTALHALHLLGGLVAWCRPMSKLLRGAGPAQLRSSIELCAVYWHYLFIVWVVLFGVVLFPRFGGYLPEDLLVWINDICGGVFF